MGAVAVTLATLDQAVHSGELDETAVLERIRRAAVAAKALRAPTVTSSTTVPLSASDEELTFSDATEVDVGEPLVEIAGALLRRAGFDIRTNSAIAGRLAAALDVAVNHWLEGAERGAGLPAAPHEHERFYSRRLIVKLGADRDLLRLVAGPHPGRGRDRQAAWQRGLAYWVAVAWTAQVSGGPLPSVPPDVLGHWRKEIGTLIDASAPDLEGGLDSRYATPY